MKKKGGAAKTIFVHLCLTLAGCVLFAFSFPSLLFKNGLPFLAWFSYIPILVIISKSNFLACAGWGAVYGFTSYNLFNYWLGAFHPLAGTIVSGIYLVFLTVVFVLLKLADVLYPKRSYIVQWTIWIAFEFLRTTGFLGYSYGITGYSQWLIIPLIQIAGITGVWGISALVTFPSFYLASALKNRQIGGASFKQSLVEIGRAVASFFRKEKLSAVIWAAALIASLVYGTFNRDFSGFPKARIALVQHNTDPWQAAKAPTSLQIIEAYRKDLAILRRLSDEAILSEPETDLVVWPETAFVPRIYWHTTYRDDQDSWVIVRELLDYLSTKDIPFLIGNDDGRMDMAKNPDPYEKFRVDYNAALLFDKGKNTETYRKLHLVPFTEHFPYKKQLPFIYNILEKADTHFWEKGKEETVFKIPKFSFSTPICFEDTFGYLSRNFVRRGADVLVNISNDAWSNSLPAQYQHLSMAVFRAVENNRSMVRATASGQTCVIDPRGRITAMADPFTEAFINAQVPLVKENTIYNLYGDYIAYIFVIIAIMLLLSGAVSCTIKRIKER